MVDKTMTRDDLLADLITALQVEEPGPDWFTWTEITAQYANVNEYSLRHKIEAMVKDGTMERKQFNRKAYHYRLTPQEGHT
jgi:hypothetical protein